MLERIAHHADMVPIERESYRRGEAARKSRARRQAKP